MPNEEIEQETADSANGEAAEENQDEELELELEEEEAEEESEAETSEKQERKQSQVARLKQKLEDKDREIAKLRTSSQSDEVVLARLEVRGIVNPDDQADVLRFAKAEGKSPIEVLEDDFIKSRLAHNQKKREEAASSVTPGNRTGAPKKSVDWYVSRGELPADPKLRAEVQDEMARRARNSA